MPVVEIHPDNYRFLQEYVYRESGSVLDGDKHYLLEARLMPIVTEMHLDTLNDLCALLRATSAGSVRQQVVEAMTTNETFFFRDMPQYDALRTVVIPDLIEQRQATRKLSFWSAAASSGQEAYSLAMMLLEMKLGNWDIEIYATDLSTRMLERARSGRYLQVEMNRGLPLEYLTRYFTRDGVGWQLNDEVRGMVKFAHIDLRQGMSTLGPFDVVLCRNVLIYFDVESRKNILREIRGAIRSGGYLLLGGSETTLNLDASFVQQTIGTAVLHRVP